MGETLRRIGDPVIHMVLDKIYEVTSIDPTSIHPDYKLGADLEMSPASMQTVLFEAAKSLGILKTAAECHVTDMTARELCDRLKSWMPTSHRQAA